MTVKHKLKRLEAKYKSFLKDCGLTDTNHHRALFYIGVVAALELIDANELAKELWMEVQHWKAKDNPLRN